MIPRCFNTQEEWNEWYELAYMGKIPRDNYCNDCTPKYQMEMIDKGRCEHPETFFYMRRSTTDGEEAEEMVGYSYVPVLGLLKVDSQDDAIKVHMKKKLRMSMAGKLVTV